MEKVEIMNIMTLAATILLALVPKMESQMRPQVTMPPTHPRPLCASQFALVNYACGRLPFHPGVPPGPDPSPDDDEGHNNNNHQHSRHGHGHEHRHRHHHHHETADEDNCCRWAKEVDNQCVCELLLRLPPFLVRPLHQYSLLIGDDCEITYSCGAPI